MDKNIHQYAYDNTKISLKDGYYTFNILKTQLENIGSIELEELDFSGKCTIKSDKTLNLQTLVPIIGFDKHTVITSNKLTESKYEVNINNGLEYVNIYCNMIDKSKNFVNGKRSNVLVQIPITTEQTLKESVSRIYPEETEGIRLSNGIYNELILKVEGNNLSAVGNVLLEIIIK